MSVSPASKSAASASPISRAAVGRLEAGFRGELLTSESAGYGGARAVWNRLHDRRPALIARCAATEDVVAAVRFAREHGCEIAVKGGGHHVAGHAVCEGGVMLDLSAMRALEIDPQRRRAVAGPGLVWGDFDAATQAHGLACTGPIVSTVGLPGVVLGGGVGWLHRKLGLAADNLISAELVTAAGDLVDVRADTDPDLLWALRGSGWNFGVVTRMELRLHPVGPSVVAGMIYFPLDRFSELIDFHETEVGAAPDELTTWLLLRRAPPHPAMPEAAVGQPVAAIGFCHCGPLDDGIAWAARLAAFGRPIADTSGPVAYTDWQRSLDARWGDGMYNDWRGHCFERLTPEVVDSLMAFTVRQRSPWADIKIPHLGGAVGRVPETATAFGNRAARFGLVIQARWETTAESQEQLAWARELRDALAPHATGGVFANFVAADEPERVAASHGPANFAKLRRLKARYDPGNLFHLNPNVPPTERR